MNASWQPLLLALRDPAAMAGFDAATWDRVVPMAFWTGVLGRLAAEARRVGVEPRIPPPVWRHLQAMLAVSDEQARAVRHELQHLSDALAELPGPVLLLKGAAYVAAGLPPAPGRIFGDIDLMVPHEQIGAAEAALMLGGWISQARTAYDERYYRQWMHEIPPMVHIRRRSVVDLHHAILPPTARIKTPPGPILEAAQPVPGWPRFHMPCAEDLLLHSATHLFHEGEATRLLRDLVDIDALWVAQAGDSGWDSRLADRAAALGVAHPWWLADSARERLLLRQPLGERSTRAYWGNGLTRAVVLSAMTRAYRSGSDATSSVAEACLYLRGHWLRMPLLQLSKHLAVKAWLGLRSSPTTT
ncbi:MAG: nucleotidyltransferase family protein [Burkholderiales bacterium]|nr:nucleotidyltransferase family protein [Burkholderiales bacterium]